MKHLYTIFFSFILIIPVYGKGIEVNPRLHVVAHTFQKTSHVERLLTSAESFHMPLDIVGVTYKCPCLGQKMLDIQNYLNKWPDDDVVMVLDGSSALILSSPEEVLERFQLMKAPFVIAAGKFCWPFYELADSFPSSPYGFRYLYSGAYIGYVWAIRELLKEICPKRPIEHEQTLMTLHYLKYPERYFFDYSCELFMPLAGVLEADVNLDDSKRKFYSEETLTAPSVILGEGSGRYLYERVYNRLWQNSHAEE